jgi:putative radical SAM enzyme (TIGR03279 family)
MARPAAIGHGGGEGVVVAAVTPRTPAARAGLRAGDRILAINGAALRDVIDFHFHAGEEHLRLSIEREGRARTTRLRRGGSGLGLELEAPRPAEIATCANKCVFCFIHQLPKGMRKSLYVKDDDFRLSFLHGNYITLTDLEEGELARIEAQRLSPLYVSVHATDPTVRRHLLRNPTAPEIIPQLRHFADHGIEFHTQIVMSPGLNDGEVLEQTLQDLWSFGPAILDVSVVPVGLTEFSKHHLVREPTEAECRGAVERLEAWWPRTLEQRGAYWAMGADELYLRAGLPLPPATVYGDFEQTENGVGSVRYLQRQIESAGAELDAWRGKRIGVLTGPSMGLLMPQVLDPLRRRSGAEFELVVLENTLFGKTVTTAGLLPGEAFAAALAGRDDLDLALLPGESLNDDGLFMDSMSADALSAVAPMEIRFSRTFVDALGGAGVS